MGIELSFLFGFVGLFFGSLLNVIIYHVLRREPIAFPGFHCSTCGYNLRPWELIPVFSFLLLKGQCSQCHNKISWRYPLLELMNGLLYFCATWQNSSGSFLQLGVNFYFMSTLLVLAVIDWDTFRLPDIFTLPLLIMGIVAGFYFPQAPSGWESLGAALGIGGLFWLVSMIYPEGMGLGDVKFVAGLGAFLGANILITIFIASVTGSIVALIIIFLKRKSFRDQIPFGPYLALGASIAFFWGQEIISFYISLFGF